MMTSHPVSQTRPKLTISPSHYSPESVGSALRLTQPTSSGVDREMDAAGAGVGRGSAAARNPTAASSNMVGYGLRPNPPCRVLAVRLAIAAGVLAGWEGLARSGLLFEGVVPRLS